MGKKNKNKHIVNWNIISLVAAILLLIISIILNYNNREISILQSELDRIEKENNILSQKNDPNWYEKMNNQNVYFESIIKSKDSVILINKKVIDSLENIQTTAILTVKDRNIVLTEKQMDNLVLKLLKAELDSIRLIEYNLKEQIWTLQDSIYSSEINYLKRRDGYNIQIIHNLEEMIENLESENKLIHLPLLIISLIVFISTLFMTKLSKRGKTATNKEQN